jgi:hypothetical protein
MTIEKWLQNLETVTTYTMKRQILYCYWDMDLDLPAVPEDTKELRKYKESHKFRDRKVNEDVLREWI